MNIEFLVICLIVSEFVDWVFQTEKQAMNKSKWGKGDNLVKSFNYLVRHSAVYAILTTVVVYMLGDFDINKSLLVVIVLLVSHMIIDTRIPVKWIMRFKGVPKEEVNNLQKYGFLQLGIDQILHRVVILIIALFV